MEEQEIANRLFAVAFYALSVMAFLAAVATLNASLIIIVGALLLAAGVFFSSGHIINNFIIRRNGVVEIYNGYRLSADLGSAVKKVGSGYRAVSMAVLDIYKGAAVPSGRLDRVLESIAQPFEFSVSMREVDKKLLLDSLETKRRLKEISVTRLGSKSYDRANELNRELEAIASEIATIKEGGKPMEIELRIKTYADSADDAEAGRWAARNLMQVANAFSTMLSLDYTMLKGEELLAGVEAGT